MLNLFLIFLTSDMSWKLSNLQKHSSLSTFPKTYTSTYHDPKKNLSCLQKEAYIHPPPLNVFKYWLEIVMQSWKKCGSHLIEGTTLRFEKATVGRFLSARARKNISILESLRNMSEKLPSDLIAVPFFYLPTKNCLGDVCEHQSDSGLLKTREFNLE